MALRHVILGLLVERPDHAYSLKHRLSPGVPRERLINDGVLYPLLAKLEAEELVKGAERPGRAGRPRRVYAVTPAGRRELRRWLRSEEDEDEPPIHALFVDHPLVKLLFADQLPVAALHAKLDRHAEHLAERIAALEELRRIAPPEAGGLGGSLLDLELRQLRDRLDWVDGLRGPAISRG